MGASPQTPAAVGRTVPTLPSRTSACGAAGTPGRAPVQGVARSLRSRQKHDEHSWSHNQSTAVRVSEPTAGGVGGAETPQSPVGDTDVEERVK